MKKYLIFKKDSYGLNGRKIGEFKRIPKKYSDKNKYNIYYIPHHK